MSRLSCFTLLLATFPAVSEAQFGPGGAGTQQQQIEGLNQQITIQQQLQRQSDADAKAQAARKKFAEKRKTGIALTSDILVGKWRLVSSQEGEAEPTKYSENDSRVKLVSLLKDGTMKMAGRKDYKWIFSEESSILKERIPGYWYGETVIEYDCSWDGTKLTWLQITALNQIRTTVFVRAE